MGNSVDAVPRTISITVLATSETRSYPIDTSFEPYRREAFRRRSIGAQRESVNLTNIAGQGTISTEGLWRREQVEWSMGAGQFSLDRKDSDEATRFFTSKGIDVFSFPMQATLLPDTQNVFTPGVLTNLLMSRCGEYVVVCGGSGGSLNVYVNTPWSSSTSLGFGTTYGGTTPTIINSIASNDTYCFLATDTGIWFALIGVDTDFQLYAAPDETTGYTTGYNLVRWANDQIIASCGARLYAFQPRTTSSGSGTPFGSPPSIINPGSNGCTISEIINTGTTATVTTNTAHGLTPGQQFQITGCDNYAPATGISLSGVVMTYHSSNPHGFIVGQKIQVGLFFTGAPNGRIETVTVRTVADDTHFTYVATKVGAAIIGTGFTSGWATGINTPVGQGYNDTWIVTSVTDATDFVITAAEATYGYWAQNGSLAIPSMNGTYAPDMLVTNQNPRWVWSDATGGQTQVYFGGYVVDTSGASHNGAIMRSDLLGSSTSSSDGLQTISSASVAQPWMLDTPVQCLPMSPDEYPLCVQSYLNYIFIGTNRGIRMTQTLSIYDPTATATGDLKSGPLLPTILQPMAAPGVTALVGAGRFVWFAWNNYDGSNTGLGRLDLGTNIDNNELTPAYASDLMYPSTNIITCLDWDPNNNVPMACIEGEGIYIPYAGNMSADQTVGQYVTEGELVTSYFDFGIPEAKIPVYFDYGMYLPPNTAGQATIEMEPRSPTPIDISVTPFTDNSQDPQQLVIQTGGSYDRGRQFQVTIDLATTDTSVTPTLWRWTLEAWPATVQGTEISAVIQAHGVNTINNQKYRLDPEVEYNWLEALRMSQSLVTYTDGETSVIGVIELIDDIPHKAQGGYALGFEGDFVVTFKTLTPFTFTAAAT